MASSAGGDSWSVGRIQGCPSRSSLDRTPADRIDTIISHISSTNRILSEHQGVLDTR
jgi:hypothetical protein